MADVHKETSPAERPLTDLQKKAAQIFATRYEHLPLQEKIDVVAQVFNARTGKIGTSPCTGKWRGTSDIFIRFDNGQSLFIGNFHTPKAKTVKVHTECVNDALKAYNPEIVRATKEAAVDALRAQEVRDNAIAEQKGLKPYTFLNVELHDGTGDAHSAYIGWYYVTLAVGDRIHAHMETRLKYGIEDGTVGEAMARDKYFAAGALRESDVDYVYFNVGFSSASRSYSLPINDDVRKRAEKTLAGRKKDRAETKDSTSALTARPTRRNHRPVVQHEER